MRTDRKVRTVLAALIALGATALWAQHPQVRKGFWIGFGFGYGSLKPSCDGCGTLNSKSSFTGHLRLGGTLSSKVLLGGDIVAWSKSQGGFDDVGGNTTASAYFYPMPESGLFLKGGLGIALFSESPNGGGSSADGTGAGITIGAGYDIRVGRNISLTPVANFLYGSVGDITSSGATVASGWKQTILEVGLDVTFH
jgi:outer membrane protein with beta-barrel domain